MDYIVRIIIVNNNIMSLTADRPPKYEKSTLAMLKDDLFEVFPKIYVFHKT